MEKLHDLRASAFRDTLQGMYCPKAALFDLDDTLAESFTAPSARVIEQLARIAHKIPVAIISGASFERIREEVLAPVLALQSAVTLYAFPDSASAGYCLQDGAWQEVYTLAFAPEQLEHIKKIIEECAAKSGITAGSHYEPKILLEKTQVRYAALGLNATEADKNAWDPDQSKRCALKALLDERLEDCQVLIGGRTTIDITRKGIDKAYGVRWLADHLKVPASEMFYVGDAFDEGGNDRVVIATGIETRATTGPRETRTILDELLVTCAA